MMQSLKFICGAILALAGVWISVPVSAAETESRVVVELYTSQGCNSCPPADDLLGKLNEQEGVIGLSLHVDYWDYIGWHDTFAFAETTERQKAYVRTMSRRYVYTPQMVINGRVQAIGSDRAAVEEGIAYVQDMHEPIGMTTTLDHGGHVIVRLDETEIESEAWLWLARYDKKKEVEVTRGENQGKMLTYYNVVRDLDYLGMWDGKAKEISLDMSALQAGGRDGCVIIAQRDGFGPILGAVVIDLDGS